MAVMKLMGARVHRVEDPKFLCGRGEYLGDLTLPRMVELAFIRSQHAHARIVRFDVEKARQAPGVLGVWTGRDTREAVGLMPAPANKAPASVFKQSTWHPLAADKVRYVGEAIGVIAAESRYMAEDAVELVDVQYQPLEPVAHVDEGSNGGGPLVHEEWGDNILDHMAGTTGDVEGAFAGAAVRVRHRFITGRHQAVPLETRGVLASYESTRKQLRVWSSTQIPHVLRTQLAAMLGLPEHRITVIAPDVGGGFGLKCLIFPEEPITAWVSMRLGRPARWLEDRLESFTASYHSKEEFVDAELAVDSEGRILGARAGVVADAGAYSTYMCPSTYEPIEVAQMIPGPYDVRNYAFTMHAVATNKPPLSPYRGVGAEIAAYAIDHLIHLAAHRLGRDPVELFRKNLIRDEQFPYTSVTGMRYEPGAYVQCFERAVALARYDESRREHHALRARNIFRGMGISSYTEPTGFGSKFWHEIGVPISSYEAAHLRMDPGGHVVAAVGTHSHGQGQETTFAQVVADELGVPLEDVSVIFGDTSKTPYGWGTWGSRSMVQAGGALVVASGRLREKIIRLGAHLLEVSADDVEWQDGIVAVRGAPSRRISVREVARQAIYEGAALLPEGEEPGLEVTATYDLPGLMFPNATHVAEVEVDPDTGSVRILRYVVVKDCGRMVNPTIVEGQIHGGVAQGIGAVLFEENTYDAKAQPLAMSFMDYLMPTAADVPNMIVEHVETPAAVVPGGFKGVGEGGVVSAPAAVVNAVSDALGGVAIPRYPLTPERVRAAALQARQHNR
ncbi:MAG: xanthine dehydrogenase family protein molybdopterin-binding subunit [Candidatus Binatia bacterium]